MNIVPAQGITGCQVDSFDASDVDVTQYTEKRAQQDGIDASNVFFGQRRIRIAGTLYGTTRALFFDKLNDFRVAFNPTLAYRESPADKGYRPMYWSVPTNRTSEFPANEIDQMVMALPHRVQYVIDRDQTGGKDTDPLGMRWQVLMVCKDPSISAQVPQYVAFTPTINAVGNFTNRGSYHAPLNMLFEVTGAAGIITVAAGGSTFTITVPSSTGNRIIRFKAGDNIITSEESGIEGKVRSWLVFQNNTSWPIVPAGVSPYSVVFSGGIALANSGSQMWFTEEYA